MTNSFPSRRLPIFLAAVAAGLTMGFVEARGEIQASTRIRRNTVWDTIQFTANGIIFVLLGEQLPMILAGATETVRLTGHPGRSEERRVGKEGVSTCRSRGSPYK